MNSYTGVLGIKEISSHILVFCRQIPQSHLCNATLDHGAEITKATLQEAHMSSSNIPKNVELSKSFWFNLSILSVDFRAMARGPHPAVVTVVWFDATVRQLMPPCLRFADNPGLINFGNKTVGFHEGSWTIKIHQSPFTYKWSLAV